MTWIIPNNSELRTCERFEYLKGVNGLKNAKISRMKAVYYWLCGKLLWWLGGLGERKCEESEKTEWFEE